jgi:hypothetical protein
MVHLIAISLVLALFQLHVNEAPTGFLQQITSDGNPVAGLADPFARTYDRNSGLLFPIQIVFSDVYIDAEMALVQLEVAHVGLVWRTVGTHARVWIVPPDVSPFVGSAECIDFIGRLPRLGHAK